MIASGSTTKAVMKPSPLVGFTGLQNCIAIERRPDGIECRVRTSTYILLLAGFGLFGPALGLFFFFFPERLDPHTPKLIMWAVWFVILVGAGIFIRYALGLPRFTADFSTGEIRYYRWWGPRPSLVLRRDEIQSMEVEERSYLSDRTRVPNYCVTVTTREGEQHALCVSADKPLIVALKSDLANAGFGG